MMSLSTQEVMDTTPAKSPPLILVYSYEPDARFLFKVLLGMLSYRTVETGSVDESFYVAKNSKPDLLLMDFSYSFEDSVKDLCLLRDHDALFKVPFVVVSNQSQSQYLDLAYSNGAKDFLVKPVDFVVLENSLKKHIAARGNEYKIPPGRFSEEKNKTSGGSASPGPGI